MAKFRSICIIPLLITSFLNVTYGIYEDQVGKFDWKKSYIGRVKFAKFESKRLIVATEENVLAGLSIKSGQILWRQVLENPIDHQIQLLHVDKYIITVSGAKNSWYIRTWDLMTGTMQYEWTIYLDRIVNSEWLVSEGKLFHIIPVVSSHIEVTIYDLETGTNNGKTSRISAPWITDLNNCVTAQLYYACISVNDITGQIFYTNMLSENGKVHSKPLQSLLEQATDKIQIIEFDSLEPSVLILKGGVAQIITLTEASVNISPYEVLPNVISIRKDNKNLMFQLEANLGNPGKLILVKAKCAESGEDESIIEVEYPVGLGAPYIIAGYCKNIHCDLLLSSTDNALSLVRLPEGSVLWTREEALSKIVATEFLELPVSDLDASIEHEFKTGSSDVASMFLLRLVTQFNQISKLIVGGQLLTNNGLVRDEFGLHKIIVVATSVGKLFAMDTLTGAIVWSYRLPNVKSFEILNAEKMFLFVQRTARYAPLPAQCILLAKDSITGKGIVFTFDPITGYSTKGVEKLHYHITQATLLPYEDENKLKPVIILSGSGKVFVYPAAADCIVELCNSRTYLHTVDYHENVLNGYSLYHSTQQSLQTTPIWKLHLGPSKLVAVSTKPSGERVHSQGRVLPDRSVYYKYVNPNLIALATLTEDPVHKHVLSVYLIDGITGLVIYSTSHRRAKGPVHLVHSENWIVYSYFSERFRRTEVVAAELYEGLLQSNSSVFSSHASQLPQVHSQSYILPITPLTMTVTLTERGITHKFILVGMSNGGVTEIPWMLVQPRFADIPCGPEESCIPYMPEIPLPSEATINYNQSVARIKGIEVAPARLESTSHVLVHGLDLYYTRVAPSKTFDVLKEDFDHRLIVLVLSLLVLASYITKHLASKKALRQAWK